VRDPEGERQQEADQQRERDPLVAAAGGEEWARKAAPGDGLRVEGLHGVAGPGRGALDGEQDVALVGGDGGGEDVGEYGADYRAGLAVLVSSVGGRGVVPFALRRLPAGRDGRIGRT